MTITLVGDFADPLSFLASQRVEQITSLGLHEIRWEAVEADRLRTLRGAPLSDDDVAEARSLALSGESVPEAGVPVPNSRAATAAYAESLTDGAGPAMRRRLFDVIWVDHLPAGAPEVIREVVYGLYNEPLTRAEIEFRRQENLPVIAKGDVDVIVTTRRSGLIVSMGRGPLTTTGQRRVDGWRRDWQQRGCPRLPLLLTDTGAAFSGPEALAWLAEQLPHARRASAPQEPARTSAVTPS